jgi:protein-S-isoprenylcysteine O-methyltransferase Ste14
MTGGYEDDDAKRNAQEGHRSWLFPRALFAFLALPGTVAGVVPALFVYGRAHAYDAWTAVGFCLIGLGFFLLLWCVRDFYVSGKGTLAPWHPPKHLVVVGLYRYVRNPMYVAVLTIVLGWSVAFDSASLLLYLVALAIGFHLRVVLYEEPRLKRQFAEEWAVYSASVRRWVPRLTPGRYAN